MNDPSSSATILDLPKMIEVGRGGTHRVYLDSDRPDRVFKVFEQRPNLEEVNALCDVREFDAYLAGKLEVRRANVRDRTGTRTAYVLVQPFCKQFERISAPVTISYWELQQGSIQHARCPAALFDTGTVVRAFLHFEPHGQRLLSLIRTEEDLKRQVLDFVERVLRYVSRTGRIIDFVGKDNVFILKEDGAFRIEAVDLVKDDQLAGYRSNVESLGAAASDSGAKFRPAEFRPQAAAVMNIHAFIRMMTILTFAADINFDARTLVDTDACTFERMMRHIERYRSALTG